MRNKLLGLAIAGALLIPGAATAATLSYTGSISFILATFPPVQMTNVAATVTVNGSGGGAHLNSFVLGAGDFGGVASSIPVTAVTAINSVRFTLGGNFAGSFTGISGGPPGGGQMGLSGLAKICLVFAPCQYAAVPVPLTPTTTPTLGTQVNGFGIGGTQAFPGGVAVTLQHAGWGFNPSITIHDSASLVTTPTVPQGFAHGPATLTSSTAQPSGMIQLVTISKAITSLTTSFPELPVIAVLNLHFVPEPGTLMLLGAGVLGLVAFGRKNMRK